MSSHIDCSLKTLTETVFSGPVVQATMQTPSGEVQVLPGHAEAFFVLAQGKFRITGEDGKDSEFDVENGVFHIKDDSAVAVF